MGNTPFIAVEGPIGVGKTSLAQKLASQFEYTLLKEIVEENPFLGKFYDNIEEWSFQTEMFFLCNRFKQLEDIETYYLNQNKPVISDYHISKNLIFAERTLKEAQYKKYVQIYDILTKDMPRPNMIIYLHASLDKLLERIRMRGREVEQNIQASYLEQLLRDYELFMEKFEREHPDIPVIRFNGDNLDFVKHQDDLDYMIQTIENHFKKGEVI
ncbi:deoxyguanosine kinase [Pontibacillus chungwhensis BH030062]|uniref:Deoxyguanosine kinase n=1 Tax=Pontibacillus chungwhensis BH030062 TaxID=1385513 RepID=A0A0A2V0Y5_9BACI|nr:MULTISPECIES: deoxynucleoside kinase [Pontibacillus]KGP92703.1 deoxyguanosine kinase [Pontibacillus chungwhensis BH030062]QST00086.1 deoxynucleoside kinase [Pontibacillus sp. ALD_SL1]